MSILSDKHAFYSYWDVNGRGINKDYLSKNSWTLNQIDNQLWANEFNLEESIRKGEYGSKL